MHRSRFGFVVSLVAALLAPVEPAVAQQTVVRLGQAVPTMSFLTVLAARALGTFKDQQLELGFAMIRGGDPAALAALDAGDIDFAAVGSDTALAAIAKGQPFQVIYSLMSQVTLELVVSNAFLKRTGTTPDDPLQTRIKALKNAIIGVSAIGGAQDRGARWLVSQGGLDRQNDIKIALIGPPPAIQAALDHGQIDGFILSPPEGRVAAENGAGKTYLRVDKEFSWLDNVPFLVLVAKTPLDAKQRDLAVRTARALQVASRLVLKDQKHAAAEIQRQFYPQLREEVVLSAIEAMSPGLMGDGKMTPETISRLLRFTTESAGGLSKPLDPNPGPNAFWTNAIVESALGGK